MASESAPDRAGETVSVSYRQYINENDLPLITGLIDSELSEPYSIFTYRYFINTWKSLCWLAHVGDRCVGAVVCKLDKHGEMMRGYIAMLVVEKPYRKYKIGTELVQRSLRVMSEEGADEVALEAEVTNSGALRLYHNLGFIRDKRLNRYYLSGVDAYRLKLLLEPTAPPPSAEADQEARAEEQNDDECGTEATAALPAAISAGA